MKRWAMIALAASALAVLLVVLSFGGSPSKGQAQPEVPHYKCYSITGGPVGVPVMVTTQFGTEPEVVVGTPSLLCLPAGKNGPIPPGWPDLKCYNIMGGQDPPHVVRLATQFGLETGAVVGQAVELCVPASRTADPPPATPHYECYTITGADPDVPDVSLLTEFGTENGVAVGQAVRLCLPAGKNSPEIPVVPHLKCYDIVAGTPPTPGPVEVNLKTQFPIENGVLVGAAKRLCVPADKQVIGRVGGVAEGPGLAGTSAEEAGAPAEGSGWSAGAYAALAAGLAALAVALSAGAWYARRRWPS